MKKRIVAVLGALANTAAFAEPATYSVEPNHSSVVFEAKHFGTSTVRARLQAKSGTITIDPAARSGKANIVIDTTSVTSGIPKFDTHLKSGDFFSADKYPEAIFTATRFTFDGDKVKEVAGDLTMLGKSSPVTLKSNNYNCYQSPALKKQVCGGDFETNIKRSEWAMNFGIPFVPDDVRLLIAIEATKD